MNTGDEEMTADHSHSPTCAVCHRRIAVGESYLVRRSGGRSTAVHQHVCFPPRAAKRPQR
jgi:hypothetical protein